MIIDKNTAVENKSNQYVVSQSLHSFKLGIKTKDHWFPRSFAIDINGWFNTISVI